MNEYADIVPDLIRSIMLGQKEVVEHCIVRGAPLDEFDHSKVNQHFSWLIWIGKEGWDRHFSDGSPGVQEPLRVKGLRSKNAPKSVVEKLSNRLSPMTPSGEHKIYVRSKRTRISSLIVQSINKGLEAKTHSSAPDGPAIYLVSPLAIAVDLLTVPDMPGTGAYALVAVRNYLYSELTVVPKYNTDARQNGIEFSLFDLEQSMQQVWTYRRERHNSTGRDSLPPRARNEIGDMLRAYLGLKEVFLLRAPNKTDCLSYLDAGHPISSSFEYARSPYCDSLPEMGELVNELVGLPLPIRGADVLFAGGLKFSTRQGLVVAIHGGPGSGKTSLALGVSAALTPFGIETLFLTAEEHPSDLVDRVNTLVPNEFRRLSIFPDDLMDHIKIKKLNFHADGGAKELARLGNEIDTLAKQLERSNHAEVEEGQFSIPKPVSFVVVLDGLHDLEARLSLNDEPKLIFDLVEQLKQLKALVILTTSDQGDTTTRLDFQVDMALRLQQDGVDTVHQKPERRVIVGKTRHQLSAPGVHYFQISGTKGVRFSPQINYMLQRRTRWKSRLPNRNRLKHVMRSVGVLPIEPSDGDEKTANYKVTGFTKKDENVEIYGGAHVFINGIGSGGKSALALKIAMAPTFVNGLYASFREKVLVVSFLYPEEYYKPLVDRLYALQKRENRGELKAFMKASLNVFHLYPGRLRPSALFNRIEWELRKAELLGDPYTSVVVDGIHNVFLQFPAIEEYTLFWPQLYSALRTRDILTISTHTTLATPLGARSGIVDDERSEPLRHALVQKTDFHFEVDPIRQFNDETALDGLFAVKTMSAIGQKLPVKPLYWSRDNLCLLTNEIDE